MNQLYDRFDKHKWIDFSGADYSSDYDYFGSDYIAEGYFVDNQKQLRKSINGKFREGG